MAGTRNAGEDQPHVVRADAARIRTARGLLLLIALGTLTACSEVTGIEWVAVPDTVELYSLSRVEWAGLPSAYDFYSDRQVVVEAIDELGNWDLAVAEDETGFIFLLPDGVVDLDLSAGIQPAADGTVFDEYAQAPFEDYEELSLPAGFARVYAFRTRALDGCYFYGKLEVLEADAERGILRFQYVINPNCGDRSLVSTE